jgi:hypothetical protein
MHHVYHLYRVFYLASLYCNYCPLENKELSNLDNSREVRGKGRCISKAFLFFVNP